MYILLNFLAHIFLSNNDRFIQIGNFIADSVKGHRYENFPEKIKTGILLHRQIDWFTDNNEIVRNSKRRLDKKYGHYKGIIIDIFYDHFLAKNWLEYSEIPLQEFTHDFYKVLENNFEILPDNIQRLMPYLIKDDWLTNYANMEGIKKVLAGMNKRTHERSHMHLAMKDLEDNYEEFEQDFTSFFEILRNFSGLKLVEINKNLHK